MEAGSETPRSIFLSFDIGIKNLACCVFDAAKDDKTAYIREWLLLPLAAPKERAPVLNELAARLFLALDELVESLGDVHLDYVLLENQPSRLNGAMKSIQMMIYSYFQLRRHWEGRATNVHMISASGKLQGHDHTIPAAPAHKTGYALNKWRAVEYARAYVAECPHLSTDFETNKKKDDLSDAMLQGIAWARKHNFPITRCSKPI